jgi:cytochrome c oxidase subunit 2
MNLTLTSASVNSSEVDALLAGLLVISLAVLTLVFGLIWTYVIRYRAGNTEDRGPIGEKSWRIEIGWTTATLAVFFALFIWGADLYVRLYTPPGNALNIYVVGKQWMWKVEHEGGQREINALHVPVGRPVQLVMTSEDVIHDFAIPAFRIKHDVLPGRYEQLWFNAEVPGSYHLFCTQFCGTDHSAMIGEVVAMTAPDYARWLSQNGASDNLAAAGRALFTRYGCSGCHVAGHAGGGGTVRAPSLDGVYGSPVMLADGTTVFADDKYIRDSILLPADQVVAGYAPVMPSFAGQISEEDLIKLIAFIKGRATEGQS